MRLIYAEELKLNIYNNKETVINDALIECIDKTTAYDPENILKQLKEAAVERNDSVGMGGEKVVNLDDAIEIVKGALPGNACKPKRKEERLFSKAVKKGDAEQCNKYEKDNRWIPCSERLPEESLNSVIGWDEYRKRCVFIQYVQGKFQNMGTDDSFNITDWQPGPEEPYKED